jgi:hypothetical protein
MNVKVNAKEGKTLFSRRAARKSTNNSKVDCLKFGNLDFAFTLHVMDSDDEIVADQRGSMVDPFDELSDRSERGVKRDEMLPALDDVSGGSFSVDDESNESISVEKTRNRDSAAAALNPAGAVASAAVDVLERTRSTEGATLSSVTAVSTSTSTATCTSASNARLPSTNSDVTADADEETKLTVADGFFVCQSCRHCEEFVAAPHDGAVCGSCSCALIYHLADDDEYSIEDQGSFFDDVDDERPGGDDDVGVVVVDDEIGADSDYGFDSNVNVDDLDDDI